MKLVALFAAVAAVASLVLSGPEVNSLRTNIDIWKEGKVPYEMAKEFGTKHVLLCLCYQYLNQILKIKS